MRNLTIYTFLCISLSTFAQDLVIFEREAKTEALFDESNPNSFLSLLRQNAGELNHYRLKGMDPDVYANLTEAEKASTLRFEGPMSDLPLVDDYGDPVIETMADGTQYFVYPPPDSLFIDLFDIDSIVFTLNDGEEKPMDRLNELHLWKRYESGMQRVLTLDAAVFMRFDGANLIQPLSKDQNDKLMGEPDQTSLWSIMRDSCLNQMKWFQNRLTNGVFEERLGYATNYVQSYFPFSWDFSFSPGLATRELVVEKPEFNAYFDYERIVPFSMDLTNSVRSYEVGPIELQGKFEGVHYIMTQHMVPSVNEYGEEILVLDENGIYQNVYPSPKEEYFFFEYNPSVFINERVVCDSAMNCQITPISLLFCLDDGGEKPELISSMSITFDDDYVDRSYLKPFLADFKNEELWTYPSFGLLKSMINDPKYKKTLSFEESTIPCEPCANKKGKYALCWKGKPVTKYIYDGEPYQLYDGAFQVSVNNKSYLLDDKGREIFGGDIDAIYIVHGFEGTYLAQKGDMWMIFSERGEYTLPMTSIPDANIKFNLDGDSYADLDVLRFVTTDENGKKGLVDAKGNQLIPHLYEDLYEEQTYGFENDEFVALTSAIGRVNKDSDWTVFGTDYKVINTLKAGEFVGTLGEHILFQEGTQINAYQSITAVHDKEYFAKDPFTQIFKGTNKGAVDANGTLIIPPLYNRIKREVTNDRAFYFCSTLDGGFDIYDTLGKLVHTFKEGRYNGTVCQGLEGYYRINADYKEGMFWYNKDKGKFELLLDPKFQYISCNSLDPDLPLAKGSVREGETTNDYFIYWDGRMELIEK